VGHFPSLFPIPACVSWKKKREKKKKESKKIEKKGEMTVLPGDDIAAVGASLFRLLNVNVKGNSKSISLLMNSERYLYNGKGCQFQGRRRSHAPLRGESCNCN
jgi:hypothetical protein